MPISVPIAPNQTLQKSAVALFKIYKMLRCLLESIFGNKCTHGCHSNLSCVHDLTMWTCFVFVNSGCKGEIHDSASSPKFFTWTNFSWPSPDFNFQFSPLFNFSAGPIKWSCHGWGGWSPVLHVQYTVQGQLPPLQGVMPRLRPDNEPHNNWVSHFDFSKEISGARHGAQTWAALCKDRWHNSWWVRLKERIKDVFYYLNPCWKFERFGIDLRNAKVCQSLQVYF